MEEIKRAMVLMSTNLSTSHRQNQISHRQNQISHQQTQEAISILLQHTQHLQNLTNTRSNHVMQRLVEANGGEEWLNDGSFEYTVYQAAVRLRK